MYLAVYSKDLTLVRKKITIKTKEVKGKRIK